MSQVKFVKNTKKIGNVDYKANTIKVTFIVKKLTQVGRL